MPLVGIIKLRSQEHLVSWQTRRLDPLSDFCFVLVSSGSVNMLVSILQGEFNSMFDLAGLGLPCAYIQRSVHEMVRLSAVLTKTDRGHNCSSVEYDRCCCRHADTRIN